MRKILFVCHGNICRSPMAEYVMKNLVRKAHMEDYNGPQKSDNLFRKYRENGIIG